MGDISIIIPSYNHISELRACLDSVEKYTSSDVEVIVVCNGSTDGSQELVKEKKFTLLDFPEPLGYTKATNEGIKVAKGDFLILLNNDTVLLDQPVNQWIDMLLEPFKDPAVGITAPLVGWSEPAKHFFAVFFCVMIRNKVFDDIGLLDEIFSPGGGEDTDFCIRAMNAGWKMVQVPSEEKLGYSNGLCVGGFPIYHLGEATVGELPNWQEIFDRNSQILKDRYDYEWKRWKLSNSCERGVFGKDDDMTPYYRDTARYNFAKENIVGKRVLEIGCSSGHGSRYVPEGVEYVGVDYDQTIIEFAKANVPDREFHQIDITTPEFVEFVKNGNFDTIIGYEVLEHIDTGRELAQELKKYCKCLLVSCPYKEIPGFWGKHHKLHNLTEVDFPDFEYKWFNEAGELMDKPNGEVINLMIMRWQKS